MQKCDSHKDAWISCNPLAWGIAATPNPLVRGNFLFFCWTSDCNCTFPLLKGRHREEGCRRRGGLNGVMKYYFHTYHQNHPVLRLRFTPLRTPLLTKEGKRWNLKYKNIICLNPKNVLRYKNLTLA